LDGLLSDQHKLKDPLYELYARHGQAEYRRENLTPVDPKECKDKNGNWTKWVIERMNPEQKEMYERMKALLEHEEPPLN